jgi:replicative DNA helicase Mcm
MKQVGYDPESGEFDVDIVETGQSKSQRDRRDAIMTVVEQRDGVTPDELITAVDFDRETLEREVEYLKNGGRLYQINDVLRKT